MVASINDMALELVALVNLSPEFTEAVYYAHNIQDLLVKSTHHTGVIFAGVLYDGVLPAGNVVTAAAKESSAAALIDAQFTVILALQYGYSGQEDTKLVAGGVLDAVRRRVHGHRGCNSRPWRLVVERPEEEPSTDGLVFYAQVWRTSVPAVGAFNT